MKKLLVLLTFLILLSVSTQAQTLRFSMVEQDPDPVQSGDVVELRFKAENLYAETQDDVTVEIIPEYPFSLYSSTATKQLGRIQGVRFAGYDATYFDFKLKVDQEAVDGYHEIVLNIFEGDLLWTLEDQFYIDIENEGISLKPYVVSSDLITSGSRGSFTIEIANRGGLDVEALELELMSSDDYKLLSTSNYIYLGDLEADDTESEDFTIYVDESTTTVNVPVKLTYEVNDNDYADEFNLVLNLLTKQEAKQVGLIKTSYTPYVLTVIVVLIIAFFVIRKYRKR